MMGCSSSKMEWENGNTQVHEPSNVQRCLESFEEACSTDPQLQKFQETLISSTARTMSELSSVTNGSPDSLPFNSINSVLDGILEGNSEVAKVILSEKMDILKDPDLIRLVEDYFESSSETLNLCTTFEKCLHRAKQFQFLIKEAARQFDVASPEERAAKTKQTLGKLKHIGDPFTREFFEIFQTVYDKQRSMLCKLTERKGALEKKLKTTKTWRKVATALFIATFVSVLVLSVVAAAVSAPPVAAALGGALTVPIGSIGTWCNSLWSKHIKQVGNDLELVKTMRSMTWLKVREMETIKEQVRKLELTLETIGNVADAHLAEDESLKRAIDEISKKIDTVAEMLDDLDKRVRKCRRNVKDATHAVLDKVWHFGKR